MNKIDFKNGFNKLSQEVYQNAYDKGFYSKPVNLNEKLLLIISEIIEAMDELRAGKETHLLYYEDKKPCGFGVEIADAIIRILDLCGYLNLDIDKLIAEKMAYNKTRPFKHNKEF